MRSALRCRPLAVHAAIADARERAAAAQLYAADLPGLLVNASVLQAASSRTRTRRGSEKLSALLDTASSFCAAYGASSQLQGALEKKS